MQTTVSILVEVPENLHGAIAQYLESHSDWDSERLINAGVALFLMQSHASSSVLVEIPESLQGSIAQYLESRPGWDRERLISTGIALFLMQSGASSPEIARTYLDLLFGGSSDAR